MMPSSIISLLGITVIFFYCVIQILNFYGFSINYYGVYLMFMGFMVLCFIILPHSYPQL